MSTALHVAVLVVFLLLAFSSAQMSPNPHGCLTGKDSGYGYNMTQKFYFDPEWNTCFAFRYYGQGGNLNRYDTSTGCQSACYMADANVCFGPGRRYAEARDYARDCHEPQVCPWGYTCRRGLFTPYCCLTRNEVLMNQAYDKRCPDGSKAGGITRDGHLTVTFARSCNDLICGRGERCVYVNRSFAKCCGAQ